MKSACLRGLLLVGAFLAFASSGSAATSTPRVLAIHFDTEVNPVTQNYLCHNLSQAAKDGYSAAVIVLDTPGGLLQSKDKIVLCELNAKLPVLVWVGPNGATAGSAGVWIAQAADFLGMAPQTNIGSSTPIDSGGGNIGSDLRRKLINHEAATLRALAQSHGRNVQWADRAVRVATNATALEALRMHVIDAVAPTLPSLLEQADGVKTKPRGYTLHLAGAAIHNVHLGFFTRILNTLIDPNILPLLFLAGLAGIGFEIFHPGVVLPGALGAVALVTALFGFSVLPISWGGLLLMLLGVALLVVDVHVTTHGALTVAGLISLAVGSIMLFQNAPGFHTSKPLVISIAVALGAVWVFAISKAVQVRHSPVEVGPQLIAGSIGEVRGDGLVYVNGELWQARTPDGQELHRGERVRVESLDGLVLTVRPEGT
ncbi:MAG: nodulation protein NfeD [Actinobacteria bacterium]|nr:MAG: nodulation protein NfeD [Actinomycetota bacterium]TML80255.1 MAG: nodulation protein NfeD [Actinomycetota bacterium]